MIKMISQIDIAALSSLFSGPFWEHSRLCPFAPMKIPHATGNEKERDLCFECGRPIGENGRWYSDGVGELVPYCAECAEREYGASAV
jgi:hypothetical protein